MSRQLAMALTLVLGLAGCGATEAKQRLYPVSVRAVTDDGDALPELEITAAGKLLGRTGPEGTLLLELRGKEGAEVLFEPRCPAGSHVHGEAATLRLRTLAGGNPPEVELACGRDKRMAALVVSAPGFANLPVLVHDREVARTDFSGTAHALLEGNPSMPMRVVLDTSSLPRVIPPSPHHDVQIGRRDQIVVFAPELTDVKPPPPKKRVVKKAKPPPVIRPEKLR